MSDVSFLDGSTPAVTVVVEGHDPQRLKADAAEFGSVSPDGRTTVSASGTLLRLPNGSVVVVTSAAAIAPFLLPMRHHHGTSVTVTVAGVNTPVPPAPTPATLLHVVDLPTCRAACMAVLRRCSRSAALPPVRGVCAVTSVAVLQVDPSLPAVTASTCCVPPDRCARVGDYVALVASPFGGLAVDLLHGCVSNGVLSAATRDGALLFTDARGLPGSEGGAAFTPPGGQWLGVITRPLSSPSSTDDGSGVLAHLTPVLPAAAVYAAVAAACGSAHPGTPPATPRALPPPRTTRGVVGLLSAVGWGSGIVVGAGVMATAGHVVPSGASALTVLHSPQHACGVPQCAHRAKLLWRGPPGLDVALLQQPCDVAAARLGPLPAVAQPVRVVGYAGVHPSVTRHPAVTAGVLSRTAVCDGVQPAVVVTSAVVLPGVSGGAVLDAHGRCVAMAVSCARLAARGDLPRLNYALPMGVVLLLAAAVDRGCASAVADVVTTAAFRDVWRLGVPPAATPHARL